MWGLGRYVSSLRGELSQAKPSPHKGRQQAALPTDSRAEGLGKLNRTNGKLLNNPYFGPLTKVLNE